MCMMNDDHAAVLILSTAEVSNKWAVITPFFMCFRSHLIFNACLNPAYLSCPLIVSLLYKFLLRLLHSLKMMRLQSWLFQPTRDLSLIAAIGFVKRSMQITLHINRRELEQTGINGIMFNIPQPCQNVSKMPN